MFENWDSLLPWIIDCYNESTDYRFHDPLQRDQIRAAIEDLEFLTEPV